MIFRRIPIYKSSKPYILILGGYGYGNLGDEAQLSATLKDFSLQFPCYDKIVLSPNSEYTAKEHACLSVPAPRVSFFDHDTDDYYWLKDNKAKRRFLLRMLLIYLSVFFDRHKIPLCFVGSKRIKLLSLIKGASLIYFSGGGYLTGKTLSRLWDGCLFIIISKIYGKPVVLSGQTIGLFRNRFDRWLSRKAFSQADLITLRDTHHSLNALKDINVYNEKISVAFDDALFCDKASNDKDVISFLRGAGISDDLIKQPYVMFQSHYWGVNNNVAREKLQDNIRELLAFITRKTGFPVLLFAMHESDLEPLNDLLSGKSDQKIFSLGYCRDFKILKAIIIKCKICVAMKHHPLIFALSEKKPVLSLAYDSYYEHKNIGALSLFGLECFNVNITDGFDIKKIKDTFIKALSEQVLIEDTINNKLREFAVKREEFLKAVADILAKRS